MLAKRRRIAALAALGGWAFFGAPVVARAANYQVSQEYFWNNPAGGSYYTAGNWNPVAVPVNGSTRANFLQSDVTVLFDSGQTPAQVGHVRVDAQNVTFNIQNANFWATSTSDNGLGRTDVVNGTYPNGLASFVVGQGIGKSGSLTIASGQFNSAGSVIGADGGTGSLTVTGTGRWNGGNVVGGEVHIGQNVGSTGTATGSLSVTNGGYVSLSNTYIGDTNTFHSATGAVNVTGTGSKLETNGRFFNVDRGSLSVSNGGTLKTNTVTSGNGTNNSSIRQATVTVDGAGSSWDAQQGQDSHLKLTGDPGGTAARLEVTNGGYVKSRYTDIVGNGTIRVDGAGSKMENSGYTMTLGGVAAVSQSEASRLVVTNGGVFDGRPPLPFLQEGATGIHAGAVSGAIGQIQVSGASSLLRADSISLGEVANSSGTMTIDTGGVVNTRVLNIGGTATAAGGTGVVNLGAGSRLEVDNLTIWKTGTLNVTGGSIVGFYGTQYRVGTLVNNGTITGGSFDLGTNNKISGSGIFTGTINVNQNGVLAPGNSPGMLTTGSQTWNSGGKYEFELNDALGVAGGPAGWDYVSIDGTLDIGATSTNKFIIDIISLTGSNLAGLLTNFDGLGSYQWKILSASGGINGFDASKFQLLTSHFQNNLKGQSFRLAQSGNDLFLQFGAVAAVPEPGTLAMAGIGVLTLAGNIARKRRAMKEA